MAYLEESARRSASQRSLVGQASRWRAVLGAKAAPLVPWTPVLVVVTVLLMWELGSALGLISRLFFPPPSVIGRTLFRLILNGTLVSNLVMTVGRLVSGVLLGGIPGLLLGLLMGWSPRLRQVVDPLIATIHPMPKISLLPLAMIIFGIGDTSKVVLIGVGTFFPMLLNAMAGVRQIAPIYFEVAHIYRARPMTVLRRIVLPASLPFVLTGVRIALNTALLLTIGTELVASQTGLGAMIWLAWETLRTEELYATLAVIGLLGASLNFSQERLASRLVPWQMK